MALPKIDNSENLDKKFAEGDLDFIVMPHDDGGMPESGAPITPSTPRGSRFAWAKKPLFWTVLAIIVLLLGGGAWAFQKFWGNDTAQETKPTRPEITLPPPEDDTKDDDADGLTNKEEADRALNPQKADTDGDGLADGDEVRVYLSDPLLTDSDSDGFDDGREVARGYSPLVKSADKATAEEIQGWTERIQRYGLHEPTPTTLKLKSDQVTEEKLSYRNTVYKYEFALPVALSFREADEQRSVGLFLAGTTPADEDVSTDVIAVSLAVSSGEQTLKDWVDSQYQPADYERLESLEINGVQAIRLAGIKSEGCPRDSTFFPKSGMIVILTWNCSDQIAYSDWYEAIIKSFKFP